MKTVNQCVCTISFIAASYCIITALIDYFHYETVASISLTEEPPSNHFVICSAHFNGLVDSQARNYTYVHRFLGDYQVCNEIDLNSNSSLKPTALMSDVKIYALQHRIYAPWHLSRLSSIYNSYPVAALISTSGGYSLFIAIEKLRITLMPVPYDTQCHHFDKYKCLYDCSQMAAISITCLRACSKPECETAYLTTLSHTAVGSDNVSKLVIEQESTVRSTVSEAKMELAVIVLDILGLLSVFFGFSMFAVARVVYRFIDTNRKLVKRILKLACSLGGLAHCSFIVQDHLRYRYFTEIHQGAALASLPPPLYSICTNTVPSDRPWAEIAKPRLADIVGAMLLARFNPQQLMFFRAKLLETYSNLSTSTYSLNGKLCYLLEPPEMDSEYIRFEDAKTSLSHLQLVLNFEFLHSSCEISAHTSAYDINQGDIYMKAHTQAMFQNTYLQIIRLPSPYKTSCQRYGHGPLKTLKSRIHCINVCALRHFKALHLNLHPVSIPIFNNSDRSLIRGDAQQHISLCRRKYCRWADCDRERFKFYKLRDTYLKDHVNIEVASPGYEVYQLFDVPITLISDTLLFLSSTISFWAGVSILQVLRSVRKLFRIRMSKKSRRKAFKVFRHTIVAIGSLVHVSLTVKKFLAYETLSRAYSRPAYNYSPFKLILIKNWDTLCSNNGRCTPEEAIEKGIQYSKHSKYLVKHFWSRNLETNNWFEMNASRVSKTYVYFSKLIITELNPSPHFGIPTPDQLIASGSSAVFKIDVSIYYELFFYVVDSVDEIDVSSARARTTVLNPGFQVIYEFEAVKISSLSAPYHLDCYDYSKHGVTTRKQCYYSCLEKRFFNIYNRTSSAFRPLPAEKLSKSIEGSLGIQFLNDDSQVSHCRNQCKKPDCRSNVFITRQNSIGRPNTEVSSITVNAQTHETSITHLPKMAMNQFVMYLGATLGLWYGVSFLDTARLIIFIESVLFKTYDEK